MTGTRSSRRAALLSDLAEIVGRDNVLADPDLKRGFEQDLTGRYSGVALCVVRPGNTEEVAAILHLCSEAQVASYHREAIPGWSALRRPATARSSSASRCSVRSGLSMR